MKIAISPGHHPRATGASYGGLTEHAAALDWCSGLKAAIEAYGFDVFEVPVGPLPMKIAAINAEKCDLAVEVHFNADARRAGRGCETLYMPGSQLGERLARAVQHHLAAVIQPDRGVKEAWYRMDRPGHVDFVGDIDGDEVIDAFVRLTHCPAIIVEPCFIHEPAVLAARGPCCAAIARGLVDYVSSL